MSWSILYVPLALFGVPVLLVVFQKSTGFHHDGLRYRFRWTR